MNPTYARCLLPLLVTGCATVSPPEPVASAPKDAPQTVTAQTAPAAPEPITRQPAPVQPKPAAPPQSPATAAKPAPRGPAQATAPTSPPPAAPTLDLNALKQQLKDTQAIGVMTKLSLKNQVDDLLQQFRDYYDGKARVTLPDLRRSYDALLMKVLSLVQDRDATLAKSIVASREPIWGLLSDPKKFATLQV